MTELAFDELSAFITSFEPMCQSLADALSEQIHKEAVFDTPTTMQQPISQLMSSENPVLQTTFSYPDLSEDEGVLAFDEKDAAVLVDLQDEGTGLNPPAILLDDHMNRLAEMMSGVVRGFGASLGNALKRPIEPGACATALETLSLPPSFAAGETAVLIELPFHIEGIHDGVLRICLTPDLARALTPAPILPTDDVKKEPNSSEFGLRDNEDTSAPVNVGAYPPFESAAIGLGTIPRVMDMLLDIPLDVTVELGRVQMLIKDVLELSVGSIVELERLAGEPVDLLVNGRLVAKGEVVVIEDNFGIRVTEVVSPADRLNGLRKKA